jgi:hypothetical protein
MDPKKILILGAYGNAGKWITKFLMQESSAHLVLAGRNIIKAQLFADKLNEEYGGRRAAAVYADASNTKSLAKALNGIDLAVVASSTSKYTSEVVRAVIGAGVDYIDVQYSSLKMRLLHSLEKEIKDSGRCMITEAGFHPGLPSMMVRYTQPYFDRLGSAIVSSAVFIDWNIEISDVTYSEFADEIKNFDSRVFREGKWKKITMTGMGDYRKIDFDEPFGSCYCAPMFFDEMGALPDMIPSLQNTGFYIAGFNWFVNWIQLPMIMILSKFVPDRFSDTIGKFLGWGLKKFSTPPYGVVLQVEAAGEKVGKRKSILVRLSHPDGYAFTAIPAVSCILQYLDGSIRKPGLWMMGHIVDPERTMKEMRKMGITITTTEQ